MEIWRKLRRVDLTWLPRIRGCLDDNVNDEIDRNSGKCIDKRVATFMWHVKEDGVQFIQKPDGFTGCAAQNNPYKEVERDHKDHDVGVFSDVRCHVYEGGVVMRHVF